MTEKAEHRTPSLDDKSIPSPPVLTTAQYDANKAAGINRIGLKVEGKK